MKASALMFWSLFAATLGQSLSNGSGRSPFKKLYVYLTPKGPFYIAEYKGRFYPMFGEDALGSYATPEEAAEDLAYGSLGLPHIDLVGLRIPRHLNRWQQL